ncbi:MAG TPA: ABC transporter permease [Candidatus Limnocylindria bacterium]|jgi:peptide/nickel transport system permease protein|nr:ABC transporter permease [Candidatus Limnocylindria bacterium]
MASSTPGSVPPPDIARAPIVSAVIADQRRLPKLAASAGPYRRAWWRLRRDRMAMAAFLMLATLVVIAYVVPLAVAIDPYQQSLRDSLLSPGTAGHALGTDHFGRDVLLRLVDGGRVSLSVGILAVIISASIGGLIGLVAGYFGGWTDRILMRLIDVKLAFPGILLALVIVTVLGTGLEKVMIAVGIGGIPRFARVVRGSVLNTKNELYVEAARSIGAADLRIMFVHLVPQVLGPAITIATFGLATAILSIASLSFLGLGAQPPTAEWGLMLSEARKYLRVAWWLSVFPGLAIVTVVLSVNLLGDAVRDALDPRIPSVSD